MTTIELETLLDMNSGCLRQSQAQADIQLLYIHCHPNFSRSVVQLRGMTNVWKCKRT